jgi:uncharacterized membrane protein
MARGRPALVLGGFALVGLAIALYLSANELAGTVAACLPGGGCETVAQSQYSHWFGIPVAYFGVVFSGVLIALVAAWWRAGDGRFLLAGYALGLVGVVLELYLVYLELFVIHAICAWCVAYGATIVFGWIALVIVQRRANRARAAA